MKTITVNTQPTRDLNIKTLIIDFADFDPHEGVTFACLFLNPSNLIIDRTTVILNGEAWQNWGSSDSYEEDELYVKNFILKALNIQESEK
jgi:hypothetical protein